MVQILANLIAINSLFISSISKSNMFGRLTLLSRRVPTVRRFSIFDKLMKDPKVQEQAAAMMQDPAAINQAMSSLTSALKDGGGGVTGMFIRNSPIKGMVDKMGGVENLERMMKDPAVMNMLKDMMADPAMVAKAQSNMENMMKSSGAELPDSKNK